MIRGVLALALLLGGCAAASAPRPVAAPSIAPEAGLQAKVTVASRFVPARTVQVWLPPGYGAGHRRYPVLYLHDGQNVFDEPSPWSGHSWAVHRALAKGIAERRMRPAILVAVWNTDNRLGEYFPGAALAGVATEPGKEMFAGFPLQRDKVAGDAYLRFLVEDVKPMIDARYRTLRGRADTMLMGSSMGGLISAYALARYPEVFGAAAGLSSAWQIGGGVAATWFVAHLPDPRSHKLYFDYGTGTDDGVIEPFQRRIDAAASAAGYTPARWRSMPWPGHKHTEAAWVERVHVPLEFLLGR